MFIILVSYLVLIWLARGPRSNRRSAVNTTVLQTRAQLDDAKWELEQTTVKAPSDGYASVVALAVGARALQARGGCPLS
jgi:multidrug resistance efflux pump